MVGIISPVVFLCLYPCRVIQMVSLYKDPRGEFVFNRSMSQMPGTITGMSLNDSEREKLRDLEIHCRDIESRLGKYEVSMSMSVLINPPVIVQVTSFASWDLCYHNNAQCIL